MSGCGGPAKRCSSNSSARVPIALNIVGRSFARDAFTRALSADAFVRAMLDFERALALVEGDIGVVPQDAARVIAKICTDLTLSAEALAVEGKRSGSLAVPLVKALTEHVARADARASAFVHYGSTSQDVLDTALVLCLKPCLADADAVLAAAVASLAGHARRHAGVVMLGRTLMQPAAPITAGLKIARWAAALHRCRLRLAEARERALCIQLGGAVGTLDALGGKRAGVRNGLAMRLHLHEARVWHDQRDELLRAMAELFSAALGEHERALGGWQAELVTIPELVDAAGGALDALERLAEGLVVNAERMRANLESLQGLVFSERLARRLSRDTDRASAQALVDDWSAIAVKERRHLEDVAIAARPSLAGQIDDVFSLDAIVGELA